MGFQLPGHIPQPKGKEIGHPFDRKEGEKCLLRNLLIPLDFDFSYSKEWISQEMGIDAMADEERGRDEEKG
jgi:hypothetical protein